MNVVDPPITVLSLCSGIGMLDEGLSLGVEYLTGSPARVVGYCERETFAASILLARMADEALEPAPLYVGNFEDADWGMWAGAVDCVVAGFPCQPWSAAGEQKGTDDERWLWPAIARCLSIVKPPLCFLENVPGLVSGGGLELVLSDLAALGFDAEWCHLSAADVGASHERERIFVLAFEPGGGQRILRQSPRRGGLVGGASQELVVATNLGHERGGATR